jgi:hypothetical protein
MSVTRKRKRLNIEDTIALHKKIVTRCVKTMSKSRGVIERMRNLKLTQAIAEDLDDFKKINPLPDTVIQLDISRDDKIYPRPEFIVQAPDAPVLHVLFYPKKRRLVVTSVVGTSSCLKYEEPLTSLQRALSSVHGGGDLSSLYTLLDFTTDDERRMEEFNRMVDVKTCCNVVYYIRKLLKEKNAISTTDIRLITGFLDS